MVGHGGFYGHGILQLGCESRREDAGLLVCRVSPEGAANVHRQDDHRQDGQATDCCSQRHLKGRVKMRVPHKQIPSRCADSECSRRYLLMINAKVLSAAVAISLLACGSGSSAQAPPSPATAQTNPKCESQVRSTYLLGPDDQLDISAPELTDASNKPVRIDGEGDIQVPLVGRVHVAGLTVQ
jgi:hypothetical protein